MPSGTTVQMELPSLNGSLSDNHFLGRWIIWADKAARAWRTCIVEIIHYISSPQRSPPTNPTVDNMAQSQVEEWETIEKKYLVEGLGTFLKRSLRLEECSRFDNGEPFIPDLVVERLQNEAACMAMIRDSTDIPVPKLLETYEEDGSFHLRMEYVEGVEMCHLSDEQKAQVIPQGKSQYSQISPSFKELTSASSAYCYYSARSSIEHLWGPDRSSCSS